MRPPRIFSFAVYVIFFVAVLLPIGYIFAVPFGEGHLTELFETRHLSLARNSLGVAFGTTFACLIIGISVSLLLTRTNVPCRNILLPLFVLPILIPPHIHAIVWNQVFSSVTAFDIHSVGGVIYVLTLAYFPFVVLLTVSGLNGIDRNCEEAALLIHSKAKTIRKITLPIVFPHIFSGAVFVFIFSIIDFGVPDILCVNVYPVEIFIQFSAFYNEKAAIILSAPLIAIMALMLVFQKLCMKHRTYIQFFGGMAEKVSYPLGRWKITAIFFCIVIIGLSAIVPVIVLILNAGNPSSYIQAIQNSGEQIGFTFIISAIAAFIIVFVGFSTAYVIERSTHPAKYFLEFGSFIILSVPAITLGITLIKIWNQPVIDWVYSSPGIILLGHMARFMPFSIIILCSGIKQLNPRLEEAALLACRRWTTVFCRIILPLSGKYIAVAFFIVFILAFGELGTTLLLIPPGKETISIKIYNLMHYGAEEQVNALSLILTVMIFAFFGIFLFILKKLTIIPSNDTT